jgi:hypothetical protein
MKIEVGCSKEPHWRQGMYMQHYDNIKKCMTFCGDFELPYVEISRVLENLMQAD